MRLPKGVNYCTPKTHLEECGSVVPVAMYCEDDDAKGNDVDVRFKISPLCLPSQMDPRDKSC
ncbi:unnamed protein product [Caretta caretta]